MRRLRSTHAFTLIELLIAVLIIGILAAIALPAFNKQRAQAKNAAAMSAVRSGVQAASAYYAQAESYAGLTQARLVAYERSLRSAAVATSATPGPSADPNALYVASDAAGTAPTANLIILCSVSQGDSVFCARGQDGLWTYSRTTVSTETLAQGAGATYSPTGWQQATSGGGGGSYAAMVAADNPLLYYRFGEASSPAVSTGSTALNLPAYVNVSWSAPGAISGDSNTAISSISNNNGGLLSAVTPVAEFPDNEVYSLELWVRPSGFPTAQVELLGRVNSTYDQGWGIFLRSDGRLDFLRDALGAQDTITSTNPINANAWSHVVATYDGSDMRLYVNGAAAATPLTSLIPQSNGGNPNSQLYVGRWTGESLSGRLDEAAVYPSVLSSARILAHYNCGASGSC